VDTKELLLREFVRDPKEFIFEYLAEMPTTEIPPEAVREVNRRVIPGYDRVRDRVQRALGRPV